MRRSHISLRAVFQQVKGATADRGVDIPADLQRIVPGELVYVKVFKRKWDQSRREGPYKVILATPTALKVEGKDVWFHLNHCCRANPQGPYPGLEPGREQPLQKVINQKGMATPPHRNRGQGGQHALREDAGQRQPRVMAAVQPRVRAAGHYRRGYQQWQRAHQRGAPQPPGLTANLNPMSHHLLEIGKIMRGQVQRERWLQRQKDRREREQRQREKKEEKKASAQNQAKVEQQTQVQT
ncbi:uncharacterized protein LOC125895877 isoform X3 [Epinephelus fuscoguttatus]|uniref:uncharacterized protein LOC125895877 isoform X3 n=1 Tax=Epinephelus fuscoguttatus TaxID=293821 RepID=UPI0020D099BD|nr:uncharacterized protein LOC125895877 isoform X3 [Epinephelus fuscoguttatus]